MSLSIRPLQEQELAIADHIFRLAFGIFRGHPEPSQYAGDTTYVKRWYLDPSAAFGAEVDGQLVGSNFAINWGSFGLFGLLTVHPDFWGRGIAQQLIEAAIACFERWEVQQMGFFTSSNSPLHLHLYQKFGFYPRFLTALMSKPIQAVNPALHSVRYSELSQQKQAECLESSSELSSTIFRGLNLEREIQVVAALGLGDTVLLWDDTGLVGFAVCHCGKDTEAGSDTCYIKFGVVRPGLAAAKNFKQLLQACESLGAIQGASRLIGGINTARHEAYQQMLGLGFRIERLGVAMHQPNEPAFNRPGIYVVDDWR